MPQPLSLYFVVGGIMKNEVWKIIPYSDEYQVSNLGRIRHLYINRYDINKKEIKKIKKITYLKPILRGGYARIRIYESRNKFKTYQVHKLVAEVFIPNPNNYPIINHKDFNRSNNCVDNLEWCSFSYNRLYRKDNMENGKMLID